MTNSTISSMTQAKTDPPMDDWSDELNLELKPSRTLISHLPNLLRFLGAGALLTAMYIFLFNGWQNGNDVLRYLMLLGHTGALTAVGLMSGHWLKESKGARLLLILSLISIPANFSILSAFLLSQTPQINGMVYPHVAAWSVDSMSTAIITMASALLVLIPLTFLGFKVLARGISKKLSLLFLASNAMLLLPIRDPQTIALMLLTLAFINVFFSQKIALNQISTKTSEGLIALGLQFLPLAVMFGRSLWLYSTDMFLLSVLAITAFCLLRQASIYLKQYNRVNLIINMLSIIPAFYVILSMSAALYDSRLLPEVMVIPVVTLISSLMLADIAHRNQEAPFFTMTAIILVMISLVVNQFFFAGFASAFISTLFGLGLTVISYKIKQRKVLFAGLILMAIGLIHQMLSLLQQFDLTSWATLAILGTLSIVIGSTIETQSSRVKPLIVNWKEKYKEWQ